MDTVVEHEVRVRYRDLDTYGHVNNVVYGTYCEEARVAWAEELLGVEGVDEFPAVVASLDLDFRRSVAERGTLTVGIRVTDVGRTSFTLSYRISDGDGVVATGESTQVHVDPETRDSRPLPDSWRDALESVLDSGDT